MDPRYQPMRAQEFDQMIESAGHPLGRFGGTQESATRPTITNALDDNEKMIEMLRQGIDSLEARLQAVLGPAPIVDRVSPGSLGGAVGVAPTAYSVRQQISNQGQRLWALQQQVNAITARVEL